MPTSKSSLITLKSFTQNKVESLFQKSMKLKELHTKKDPSIFAKPTGRTAALLFFEPSTRTRFSFEAACVRAGYHPMVLDRASGTSLEKGETITDTLKNIEALRPLFFVIRCNKNFDLEKISHEISVPVLNAGWGTTGHPTQALLDTLSLYERWQNLKGKKLLIVGDVKHSRVVASHFELAPILGYEIGVCAPKEFLPETSAQKSYKYFENITDGLKWADAVMALRVQKERHDGSPFDTQSYRKTYGLNSEKLQSLKADGFIMHPGPINYGIEMEESILADSRSLILQQVENGVFLREALIRNLFEENI